MCCISLVFIQADREAMPLSVVASSRPVILAVEPQLLVRDMAAAIDFYTIMLGFDLVFSYGEPPFYAQVGRDNARLNLRLVPGAPQADIPRDDEPDILSATLTVDDAEPLFLELKAAGVDFHQTLRSEPWGARTFIVSDRDNNLLCFAGRDLA
jgi:catechol 2,3-dioxygenase-like lactoylglutathione lyase family enzyme